MSLTPEEITALQSKVKDLETKNTELSKLIDDATKPPPKADPPPAPKEKDEDLDDKAKRQAKEKLDKQGDNRKIESALRFNISSDKFIEDNKSIFPKEIGDIFALASKEPYDSELDRANATKSAVIKSFFSLQENLDHCTTSQRSAIDDYLKRSQRVREEKADEIFENIFVPTVEMIKKIKKAEQVAQSRGGYQNSSDSEAQYKEMLQKGSRKHFLGEK